MKTRKIYLIITILAAIGLVIQPFSVSGVSAPKESVDRIAAIPRDEIVWSSGYWAGPTNWNPYWWDGKAWGEFFMYMPLFDINYETGELLGFIGETFEWTNETTMTITLRPEAEWSDGTPITADDVIFTWGFLLAGAQGSIAERVASYEKVSATEFIIHVKPEYPYSKVLFDHLLGNCDRVIGAKHVWMEIYDWMDDKDMNDSVDFTDTGWDTVSITADWAFKNNWLDDSFFPNGSAFPDRWKVASGPYVPFEVSETLDRQVYIRDDSWWGNDVWNAPRPKYVGQLHYPNNFQVNQAFANDEQDWYGGYYPRIWELIEDNPNILTWTQNEEPYFLPISGMVELVPNHLRFPFNQEWLREALAYAIDAYDMSEVAASGYLQRARQGYVDDRSPTQSHVYDSAIQAEYGIDFNITKSLEILDENCFELGGAWYTDDVPAASVGMVGYDNVTIADEVTDDDGWGIDGYVNGSMNVKLGGWDILTVYGWSDSMLQSTLLSDYFTNTISISVTPAFIEYGTYMTKQQGMDFSLLNWVMGFGSNGRPWSELGKFIGDAGNWVNFSAWYNPQFAALHEEWETIDPTNVTGEKLIASMMQELLADEIPAIPISPNGYWMVYNTKYWRGWPNIDDNWIHVCAPWMTSQIGTQLLYILNLIPADEDTTPTSEAPSETSEAPSETSEAETSETSTGTASIAFSFIMLAIAFSGILVKRRRKK
ncbi:MAG: ABC transporter substrate-binding protein [Candidatus Hodarchaeales archaeon]|jgi:peptide/nickel transport system substrate-binding protein